MTWVPHGNSSEAPLVVAAAKAGIWEDCVAQEYPRVLGSTTRFVASVKGAPNYILKNCTRFCQTDGSVVTLTDEQRNEIREAVDDLSSQALRVLVLLLDDILAQGSGPTYGNCAAFPGLENEMRFDNGTIHCEGGEYLCMWDGIARAQTMTFIAMTLTEVFRAYTVRNLKESMFVSMFSNPHLQGAVVVSAALTVFVTNVPVVMDKIFGFAYISAFQWLVSFFGAVNAVFWSELTKWILRRKARTEARWASIDRGFEDVLVEIRHVRQRLDHLEGQAVRR
ncbi:hypothetical protein ATCC90586_010652 [Pythium insidiosum]|nr:hypothetical protein ATCC90586_010652 [Pythium insidiosum]